MRTCWNPSDRPPDGEPEAIGSTKTVDDLQTAVRELFVREAKCFRLRPSLVAVSYVVNWGGFVNHSFRVSDGLTRYHLKLATTDDAREALRQWQGLDRVLRRHHAPPVLEWIEVPGGAGLLFPHVDGSIPRLTQDVLREVMSALGGLGRDAELTAALPKADGLDAIDAYFETYHDRFTEDLRAIRAAPPPFLSPSDLEGLEEEVGLLMARVRSDEAFAEALEAPVHGDPWLDNVLWKDPASWHMLDWDDLRIGDPAIDLTMLIGPDRTDLTPLKYLDQVAPTQPSGVARRLPVLGRASLLDWVIDPLADWIEAGVAPNVLRRVRKEKERVHRSARELYRELYGS